MKEQSVELAWKGGPAKIVINILIPVE